MYSEDYERFRAQERNSEDVYSKPVRAGKRTYFFDVKSTKGNNDFYLTITESKRRQERDGSSTRRTSRNSRKAFRTPCATLCMIFCTTNPSANTLRGRNRRAPKKNFKHL